MQATPTANKIKNTLVTTTNTTTTANKALSKSSALKQHAANSTATPATSTNKPQRVTTTYTNNDTSDEIEEISKKISEHADAIYRTWKSRGLAPEKLLDFYATAAADPGGVAVTAASAADFFTAATAASTTPEPADEGLQKLVSTFVLKDKEQRGVKTLKKQEPKAMTKTPTTTAALSTTELATGNDRVTQKKISIGGKQASNKQQSTSAILLKAADVGNAEYVEAAAVAAKTKTVSKISKALSGTAIASATPGKTTTTPVTSSATSTQAKPKKLILHNSDSTGTSLSMLNNTSSSSFASKNLQTLQSINTGIALKNDAGRANSPTLRATSPKAKVNTHMNVDVDINLDLDVVNNLTQVQTNNLLKIKELLQQEEQESAKKQKQQEQTEKRQLTQIKTQSLQQPVSTAVNSATKSAIKTQGTTTATTTTTTPLGTNKSTLLSSANVIGNSQLRNNSELINGRSIGNQPLAATTTNAIAAANDQQQQAKKITKNSNSTKTSTTKTKATANTNTSPSISASGHDIVDVAKSLDNKIPLSSMITITTTTATIASTATTTTPTLSTSKTLTRKSTPTTPMTTLTTPTATTTTTTSSTLSETMPNTLATTTIALATLASTLMPAVNTLNASLAAVTGGNTEGTATELLQPTQSPALKKLISTPATTPTITGKIIKNQLKDNVDEVRETTATTVNTTAGAVINKSHNHKRAVAASSSSAESGMEVARSTMPTPTKVKAGRAALTNGQDKNIGRPILTRGSVAERVLMFEKCPDVRNAFLNIKRPQQVDEPPKALLKVKLHATPPPPPEHNSLQREIRSSKSVYIPRFYFPHGKPQPQIALERTLRGILSAFDSFPNNQVTKDELPRILKLCGIPFYWRMPVMVFCQQGNSGLVERQRYVEFWKQMNVYCHDDASRFIYILSRGQRIRQHILPEDFVPMVQDVVDTHPGLAFLKEATEFHSRYVHTVIARIFYSVNRSWSGKITMSELKKSDLLEIIQLLEEEDDINQIMAFFSYEHFYVIYCKFWELDKDHDLLINQEDLARHSDHALSQRIVERIFSGCVTRNDNRKDTDDESKMTYTEFVWFLLSEEDKRTPTAIEYWFRCMDIDGDGVLSMYELEYFYEEQQQRMESIGIETLPFEDCLCQMLDMIKPTRRDCVTLGDLKRCKMTHVFFDTFFNLEKYLDHEQRDPFATQRDEYSSDWDRFAAQEYELLITEENE